MVSKNKSTSQLLKFKNIFIDRIPCGWKIVKLKDENIAEIRSNKTINKVDSVAFIPMEYVPDASIYSRYEMRLIKDIKSFTYCEAGDLLLAKITPSLENGKQGIVPDDVPHGFALATTEVFPILSKGINKLFLFYVLKLPKIRNKIISSMTGTTGRQRASKESVENLLILLPPLPEQQKIAEILSTVDRAIEKVDETIDQTQRVKKGLMQELLTRGIGHKELVKTKTAHPYIRVVDFKNMSVDKSNLLYLNSETYKLIKNYTISSNDIYISIAGSVGIAGIIPQELNGANLTENAAKLCNLNKVKKEFLAYILNSPIGQNQIFSFVGKAQQPKLALFRIKKIKIPLPPLPEQQKIAEILSTVDERLELLRKRREKLEKVKKGLMNDLLTGKKRVKLEA